MATRASRASRHWTGMAAESQTTSLPAPRSSVDTCALTIQVHICPGLRPQLSCPHLPWTPFKIIGGYLCSDNSGHPFKCDIHAIQLAEVPLLHHRRFVTAASSHGSRRA